VDVRQQVRLCLLDRAREDDRITGAALTGSAARETEDRWSDVDLLFGTVPGTKPAEVVARSTFVYRELGALHHFDLRPGAAIYPAFQLAEPALEAFARSLDALELARALEAATRFFMAELERNDVAAAERLAEGLLERATSYSELP
jgi:hypothetical protein